MPTLLDESAAVYGEGPMSSLILAALLTLFDTPGGLDPSLLKEIGGWKKGMPPPARLLSFPHGRLDTFVPCGIRALGDAVEDYICRVNDVELLKALMFDPRGDAECFRAAVRQLLDIRGVREVRTMLAERRNTHPADFSRRELAALTQLLSSPYARIKVASLDKKNAEKDVAEKVLNGLKSELAAGISWDRAYGKAADLLLDKQRSKKEGGWRTFLGYEFDGVISPTGFDVLNYRISDRLDADHIRKLFEAKGGVHLLETKDRYWLYYVEKFSE